ncbi:ABC transporter ATP-binding protein [Leifsonia sp. LS1]|uniref:ABC transporter ATP-binding protein n=1 Tax=Leifsonia sp. LS1 TaxID=2828483 RepID=UPI001CFF1B61|nr:ABC transporter ATP-binding protein [Leifsonia sp. LS1]GIT81455.1 ABC transporter ATP-binding protein [Leifsonia sp. LS1]
MSLEVNRLTVRLGGQAVLDEVVLTVRDGAMVGLLGPNGSGKSTLLRALWRALVPECGAVLVDGADVAGLPTREVARRIGVLMQDDGTDPRYTVREVVETGRLPHRRMLGADDTPGDPIGDALHKAGVEEFADRRIDTLSGGQRQRVLAARTLAQATPVVLLDEPTNHLDLAAQHELLALFRRLGVTVVTALHDLNLAAAYCDELHLLDAGRLVASGTPDEVLTPERIGAVFGVAAAITTNPLTGTRAVHLGPRPVTESTP